MNTSASTYSDPAPFSSVEPARKNWTRDEYHRLAEQGWFEGQRTELIGGEIFVMNPQKHAHFLAVDKVHEALSQVFSSGYWVRMQGPLKAKDHSEPEPDVSVVEGERSQFSDHPTSAALVVEVSHSTLEFDRRQKTGLYAATGVAEYWIVNLNDRILEVYRQPIADQNKPFGYAYQELQTLRESDQIATLEKTNRYINVADLLP